MSFRLPARLSRPQLNQVSLVQRLLARPLFMTRNAVQVVWYSLAVSRAWHEPPMLVVCDSFVLVVIDRDATKSTPSKLLKIAQQRFKQYQRSIVIRFSGDGKSDITVVVWDFGGQKVNRTNGNQPFLLY